MNKLKKYLYLYKKSQDVIDEDYEAELISQMEDLYYELDDDDIAYL